MGKSAVNGGVGAGTNSRVVLGVGVIMGDGTEYHGEVLHDLEGEEEGYTPEGRKYRGKSEADEVAIQQPLLEQVTSAVADKDCTRESETFRRAVGESHLHMLSPAARPLYTHEYTTVGRGRGASGSMLMVYFLPYQVRLAFVSATKTPFSGSVELGVRTGSVKPEFRVGGKTPKTELYREIVGVRNGLVGWAEWPETEFEAEPAPSGLATGGRDRHKSLMRRSSKSWQVGMMVSMEKDQTTNTRSSRYENVKRLLGRNGGTTRRKHIRRTRQAAPCQPSGDPSWCRGLGCGCWSRRRCCSHRAL